MKSRRTGTSTTRWPCCSRDRAGVRRASLERLGRDIFWQPDRVSDQFGADWLQRHLGPDFRVHKIQFRESHPPLIGTTLVPMRRGIVLLNPARPCIDGGLELFERTTGASSRPWVQRLRAGHHSWRGSRTSGRRGGGLPDHQRREPLMAASVATMQDPRAHNLCYPSDIYEPMVQPQIRKAS